jgi:hypothetical protein
LEYADRLDVARDGAENDCGGRHVMGIEVGGLIGLVILVADIWAIINVFQSSASMLAKLVWIVLILLLPVIGFIAWLIAGPRAP